MKFLERIKGSVPWFLRRAKGCSHIGLIQHMPTAVGGCTECLKTGDSWFHLRVCLICGHVGCCDMSKNKHAGKHFRETGHPLIQSAEVGEDWVWCYVDELMLPGSVVR